MTRSVSAADYAAVAVACGTPKCATAGENRVVQVECNANNCSFGEGACGNRAFSTAGANPWNVELKYCGAKGWGAFATQDIPSGAFVVEYVGDVIDRAEVERRKKMYQESGNPHFYLMEIGPDVTIDAGLAGGLARFLNHSCGPNCMTQKWQVGNETRVAMFAVKDISAGEELSYDYQWCHFGESPWKCLCGAETCRGFLADAGAARKHRATLRARRKGKGLAGSDEMARLAGKQPTGPVSKEATLMPLRRGGARLVPKFGARAAWDPDSDQVAYPVGQGHRAQVGPVGAIWGSTVRDVAALPCAHYACQ